MCGRNMSNLITKNSEFSRRTAVALERCAENYWRFILLSKLLGVAEVCVSDSLGKQSPALWQALWGAIVI